MKIGIVGGTGNISTAIVRLLLQRGHAVVCFNRGQAGAPPAGARVLRGDRHATAAFEQAMQAEKFDAAIDMLCFNAADAASSRRAFRGVGMFVHCSTVCTYGVQSDWLPVTEDHALRPITAYGRNKAAADAYYLEAHYRENFPVVLLKPSTTYGPQQGLVRQLGPDLSWLDRIRKGKPLVVCGDGTALHQHLHVDDAALAFAGVLEQAHCSGQTYNVVNRGHITWADYHRTAMRVLGRTVDLVGIPFADLQAMHVPQFDLCAEIFAHHTYYSPERLLRAVPGFAPQVTLEDGMRRVIDALDAAGRIPDCDAVQWEDRLVNAQLSLRPQ